MVVVGHRPFALREHGVKPPVEEYAEPAVGELAARQEVFRGRAVAACAKAPVAITRAQKEVKSRVMVTVGFGDTDKFSK